MTERSVVRISVITAVYNARDTIAVALESVLAQSYSLVETVVIDGASTDGTAEILERYRPRISRLVNEPDDGIYDALNKGIRLSSGDVVGFLHADDLFASDDALTAVAEAFEDPTVEAVYGDLVYVRRDAVGSIVRQWRSAPYRIDAVRRGWMPPHPTFYVRRSVYQRVGGFDTRYRIAADYDSIVRILFVEKAKAAYIPKILVRMRTGGVSNRSLANLVRKSIEDYRIARAHRVGGAITVLLKNILKLSQLWRRESASMASLGP
jgi:glycosyltransferase involved in cell wall biosynthesis